MKTERIQLAVVGCGGIVLNAHAPALNQLTDRYEVTAVCDLHRPAAENLARILGLSDSCVFSRVEDVAGRGDVDAALVSLPHHLHHSAASVLIACGKHVLVEKPFALNLREAEDLVQRADAAGVKLVVGHCQRHSPLALAAKEILAEGSLGEIFLAQATALQYLPMYVPFESGHWLYSAKQAGGGIVISVGVHKIDLLRFLLGDVASVSALFETRPDSDALPFEWSAGINLKFHSGAIATVSLCYKAYSHIWEQETLALFGEEGSLRASGLDDLEVISKKLPVWARKFTSYKPPSTNKWVAQLSAFHESVVNGSPNPSDAGDALKTMALLDAIYSSGFHGGKPTNPVR